MGIEAFEPAGRKKCGSADPLPSPIVSASTKCPQRNMTSQSLKRTATIMHASAASGRALTGAAGMLAMASSSGSDQMDEMVNRFSNLLHVDSLNLARASGMRESIDEKMLQGMEMYRRTSSSSGEKENLPSAARIPLE